MRKAKTTEIQENDDLMGTLAKCVQHYLLVGEGDDGSEEQKRLRDLCSTLARLLGRLLHDTEKWSRYYLGG